MAFTRTGYSGLVNEINLDVGRLGKRNLGRDDRVLATWGREVRYPYLDEEFVAWVLGLPVWEKCFFEEDDMMMNGKKALRLVAVRLGMQQVARERKRAIQFGARTAKMEHGRGKKGTDILD